MITRLEVDGFKSLQGFAVDLEPLTVFIGPNGAGKSNILEALALLSRLASMPIVDAFKQGRGRAIDQFSRFGDEVATEMRFAVEFLFLAPDGNIRSRYELVIGREVRSSGTERLSVLHESIRSLGNRPSADLDLQFARSSDRLTALTNVTGATEIVELTRINLASCQWLRLDLTHLAGPSDRVDTGGLRSDGSNLPTVLADLAPELLGEIRADLVALVPGLSSFVVTAEDDALRIDFELSGGERLPARLVSDGTLRLLALLTALRLEPRPQLVGIEEPENGIYPGRLLALVELLRKEAATSTGVLPTQILLTTHSPLILAALREHSEHLRFIDTVHRDHRRVTRARKVGQSGDPRHLYVSTREIDQLLNTITGGEAG